MTTPTIPDHVMLEAAKCFSPEKTSPDELIGSMRAAGAVFVRWAGEEAERLVEQAGAMEDAGYGHNLEKLAAAIRARLK